jgi:hypothetical protein
VRSGETLSVSQPRVVRDTLLGNHRSGLVRIPMADIGFVDTRRSNEVGTVLLIAIGALSAVWIYHTVKGDVFQGFGDFTGGWRF